MSDREDRLEKQIYASMQLKETDELVEIFRKQNKDEWSDQALNIAGQILTERLGQIPEFPPEIRKSVDQPSIQQLMVNLVELQEKQTMIWDEIRGRTHYLYVIGVLSMSILLGLLCFSVIVLFVNDLKN